MTSKQRAYLKGLAMTMDPIFQFGKNSLTPENTAAIAEALEARELIKISVLNCSIYLLSIIKPLKHKVFWTLYTLLLLRRHLLLLTDPLQPSFVYQLNCKEVPEHQ